MAQAAELALSLTPGPPAGTSAAGSTGSTAEAGGAGDRPALRRLTHLEPATFAGRTWGERLSLSRREQLPAGFGDLLDVAAIDTLLSRQGLRSPFLRVAKDGRTFPVSRFTRSGGVGAMINDQVDDVALTRLFADGATLVLQGLHRTHPPVLAFVQQLAADLGHPVQANAYVTPPQAQGFSAHYDVHDVFVLQVAGEKRWMIHDPVLRHPRRDQPWTDRREQVAAAAEAEPLLDVVLRPGDALYLPAGFLHAAQALGETSIHLTLGIHTWTRAHLVEKLAEHLLASLVDDEHLRAPLPLGVDVADPAALALAVQEVADAMIARLPGVTATDVAASLARTAAGSVRAEPVNPLAQVASAAAVDLWTVLRWRSHLRAELTEVGGRLVVRTPDGEVDLPPEARHGVERLVRGEVLTVAELGDGHDGPMEDVERLDVARTLLRAALAMTE